MCKGDSRDLAGALGLKALDELVLPDILVELDEDLAALGLLVEDSLHVLDAEHAAALGLGERKPIEEFWRDVEAGHETSGHFDGVGLEKARKYQEKLLELKIFSTPKMAGGHVTLLSSLGSKPFSTPRMAGGHVTPLMARN